MHVNHTQHSFTPQMTGTDLTTNGSETLGVMPRYASFPNLPGDFEEKPPEKNPYTKCTI